MDSLYLDNQKVEDLKIIEKSDKELKVAFSVEGTGDLSFYAKSHFMGLFSSSSEKADIEVYDSEIKVPQVTELVKNGRSITSDAIRLKEAFTLGIKGEDLPENVIVYVNGTALKDGKVEDGVLNVQVDEDLIEKINKETKITVQICPKTKEGYETSAKSNDIEKNVYGRLIDNSWIDNCWRNDAQTDVRQIMKIGGIDNNKDAVNSRLDELYNQGVRFVEYSESYGIDFQNIAEYIKSKEDLQLLVEVSEDMDKQTLYDMLNEAGLIQKTIAVVDTPAAFEEWNNINKAEDYLKIMFRADNDGMTMQQSLDYWKEYNIKAVCFGTNSYWSNVYLRNEDRVKEQNIAFFCENPTNDEERDFMLNPTDYTDNSEELQGITGFMTTL